MKGNKESKPFYLELKLETVFILVLLILGIYLLYSASITKMLGEDEAVYVNFGYLFSNFNFPAKMYTGAGMPSPTIYAFFVPLVYSIAFIVSGMSLEIAKIVTAIFSLLTILLVYFLGKKINVWCGIASASLLLSIAYFTHMSLLAYTEIPIALFSAFATILLFEIIERPNILKTASLGLVLGVSYYVKFSALIMIFSFIVTFVLFYLYERKKEHLKTAFIVFLLAAAVISAFIVRNILLYNYPFFEGLNFLFKTTPELRPVSWILEAQKILSPGLPTVQTFLSNLGIVSFLAMILCITWLFLNPSIKEKNSKLIFFCALFSIIFMSAFIVAYITGTAIMEPRYLSIIYPQIALLGGFVLWKIKERSKWALPIIILVIIFGIYTSATVALTTSQSQRYPQNYIDALTWIKQNTDKNALIMTTYSGSAKQFSERDIVWGLEELPKIMSTTNTTYIHEVMKKYNINYVLIWKGVLGEKFIIPESNLIGVFTYEFLNAVIGDTTNFNVTYQNQDNIIFKVL